MGDTESTDYSARSHQLCKALNDILLIINSTSDVDEMLNRIVVETAKAIGSDSARIAVREGEKWHMKYVYRMPEQLKEKTFSDEELPHAALAMMTKSPVVIADAFNDDRTNVDLMRQYGIRSVVVVPLVEKVDVIGCLFFNFLSPQSFSEAEIEYAEKVAVGLSIAIQNTQLLRQLRAAEDNLREENRLSRALSEIDRTIYSNLDVHSIFQSVLRQAANAIGAETAMLFTREKEGWMTRYVYKLSQALVGRVFTDKQVKHTAITARQKEPMAVCDARHDNRVDHGFIRMLQIRSLLDFPLIVQDEVIGDLVFHYHSKPVTFSDYQIDFVRKLQISISLALKNARLFEELQEAKTELEAFNYTVAHDLRNGLNLIAIYAQELRDLHSDALPGEATRYLGDLTEATFRMSRLIDGILSLSQLSHTHALSSVDSVDLSAMAETIAKELKQTDPARRVKFVIKEGITARADPVLIQVVMSNLLGNAWKFTALRDPALIEFGVDDDAPGTYFVKDNGIGFEMTDAEKIFSPFQRLKNGQSAKGLGIGLATVERIIRRHGGKVWATAEPERGAVFYFTVG